MMEITNLTNQKIDEALLQEVAAKAFSIVGEDGLEDLSLVLTDDDKIQDLNKKYRNKDKVTDVLSFEELNEIFICLPEAQRQARLLKTSLKLELTRLLVHGIVHLKGYDHEKSEREAERMFALEKKIFEKIDGENKKTACQ